MQLLSLGPLETAAGAALAHTRLAEFYQREEVHHLVTLYLVLMGLGQLANIACLWLASKAVAFPDRATLRNALKTWSLYLLFSIGMLAVDLYILPILAEMHENQDIRATLIAGGGALFSFLLAFFIPMKVYVIGFLRALGLLLLTFILSIVTMAGLGFVIFTTMGGAKDMATLQASIGKTQGEQAAFLARLSGREAPDELDRLLDDALHPIGPPPSLREREAMVLRLQQMLEARKRVLPFGNGPAVAAFQAQLQRYLAFLDEVKTERRALPAGAAH